MEWRLGCDLGTNSLGWCAVALENGAPIKIIATGSRIFADGRDPKSKASLAVDRRAARAMRRRRDRFKQRQCALLKYLEQDGLFPSDGSDRKSLENLDPYLLRAQALDEKLPLHHIGRAFFHLNQRRGFKSNRKTDRSADDETGKIAIGIDRLRVAIEDGARTFGEFLHMRRLSAISPNSIPSVRTRLRPETGEGAKGEGYDFYPGRTVIEEEFNEIWEAQASRYPEVLTAAVHDRLFEIVFDQRPLKEGKVGKCMLISSEVRLPKAHPLFQRRRLLEEINALRVVKAGEIAERLTREQRDLLFLKLKDKRRASFESLRKVLRLDPDVRFNKESTHRSDLAGDEVSAELGSKTRFGNRWAHFQMEQQWQIISRLLSEEDEGALKDWLQKEFSVTSEEAVAIAASRLPQGYGRLGRTATERLIEALHADVLVYSEAVERAGLGHHSDFRTGEILSELPYYGMVLERHLLPGTGDPADSEEMRIGRLTNPTVHIGLNQLRHVVNGLIRVYGRPTQIALEIARDLKQTDEEKGRHNRQNNENRLAAVRRSQKLIELGKPDTGANRALLKLWEELNPLNVLDRRCIYSGRQISIDILFSDAVEVDHILPFSATLDDSGANKIVCLREANRAKRQRSPFEAWGNTSEWEDISLRAAALPREKRWRFEPDAMQRFADQGGFLARQLVDTQYLSRLAHEYLVALYPDKGEDSGHVWVSPGRLTELVRRKLGLNDLLPDHNFGAGADQPKNRLDHRHHAIDAAVVAIIDRSMIKAAAQASRENGSEGRERVIIPEPWDGFRDELRESINGVIVSHRPDRGTVSKKGLPIGKDQTASKLHNDTAYGLTGEMDARGNTIVVHRVPLTDLKLDDLEKVRNDHLKVALRHFVRGREGKEFEKALLAFPNLGPLCYRGIRRVRICEPLSVIPIRDESGRAYKGYKGDSNYRYDVWEMPDGKWTAEVVSMFEAHQDSWESRVRAVCPTARKVLKLRQNDLVAIEDENLGRRIMRIVKFGQGGQVTLVEAHEAGDLKRRDAAPQDKDPFKYMAPTAGGLKKLKARQVRVDALGRVFDPGFPARTAKRVTRKPAIT